MRYRSFIASALVCLARLSHGATTQADDPAKSPFPSNNHAPLPDERLGIRTAPLLLLSRADVRADLGLSVEQSAKAETALADLYVRGTAIRGQKGARAVAARRAIDEAEAVWFKDNLTASQRVRMTQIDLQWEGPSALIGRPVVADTLTLTTDQRAALAKAVDERDAVRAVRKSPGAEEEKLAKTALSLLDPTQKERWRLMLGHPFTPRLASKGDGQAAAR